MTDQPILTREEIAFLDYLAKKSWTSSGSDHRQFKRLVDRKLVQATTVSISDVFYEITGPGRAALAKSKIATINDPCDGCRYQCEEADEPWCFIYNVSAKEALSINGPCGPNQNGFQPLR